MLKPGFVRTTFSVRFATTFRNGPGTRDSQWPGGIDGSSVVAPNAMKCMRRSPGPFHRGGSALGCIGAIAERGGGASANGVRGERCALDDVCHYNRVADVKALKLAPLFQAIVASVAACSETRNVADSGPIDASQEASVDAGSDVSAPARRGADVPLDSYVAWCEAGPPQLLADAGCFSYYDVPCGVPPGDTIDDAGTINRCDQICAGAPDDQCAVLPQPWIDVFLDAGLIDAGHGADGRGRRGVRDVRVPGQRWKASRRVSRARAAANESGRGLFLVRREPRARVDRRVLAPRRRASCARRAGEPRAKGGARDA